MLASMERQGLVRRTPSTEDRRTPKVERTAKGQLLLQTLRPTAAAHERRLCRGMTESGQAAFIEALHGIGRTLPEP